MLKVIAIENFYTKDFSKLQNLVRAKNGEKGKIFIGDTFECSNEIGKYMANETKNPKDKAFVKIIEVLPTKPRKNSKKELTKEE